LEFNGAMAKRTAINILILLCLVLLGAGCATHYNVSLHYQPQEPAQANELLQPGSMFSACIFVDARDYVADKQRLGTRVAADGTELPINSTALLPGYAVAAAMKTYLFSSGHSVYGGLPGWDMKPESIDSQWGQFAIGGSIDEFEARAWEDMGFTRYRTQVSLRVVVADVRSRRVIYTAVVDAESSLQHVYFSEALMQREINKALSSAIERFFANQALYDALQQAQQVRVNTLQG
jgi:hypothetical protein